MMSQLKAVAVDLDGTLLDGDSALPPQNREALEQFRKETQGPVVIATGRARKEAALAAKALGDDVVTHI